MSERFWRSRGRGAGRVIRGLLALPTLLALSLSGWSCGSSSAARVDPPDPGVPSCGRHAVHPPSVSWTPGRPLLGEHADLRAFRGTALCREAATALATGVGLVREELRWSDIEPARGHFRWRVPDEVVGVAAQYGLAVLPVLDSTPAWAGPIHAGLPHDSASYAAFVGAVVARYGPGGAFWREHRSYPRRPATWIDLYNEPYQSAFSGGAPDPDAYARLVAAAAPVARRADARIRLLIEADSEYSPAGAGALTDWMAALYRAVPTLGMDFDGVSVHPYGDGGPAAYVATGPHGQVGRLEQVRADLVAHGDGEKPLWVTEIGWPTCASRRDGCVRGQAQASYLRGFIDLAVRRWRAYVAAVFVYGLQDFPSHPASTGAFGVLTVRGRPKPAWYVLRAFAAAERH